MPPLMGLKSVLHWCRRYALPLANNSRQWSSSSALLTPEFDYEYLCNPGNTQQIKRNIQRRKGIGDIDKVIELHSLLQMGRSDVAKELQLEAAKIPNTTHDACQDIEARQLELIGEPVRQKFVPKSAVTVGEDLALLRTSNVVMGSGERSYYLIGALAELERALVRFTLSELKRDGFQQVSVPDLLFPEVVEACGFPTDGVRSQVFKLADGGACLAGTAEMPLAALLAGRTLAAEQLPLRLCAVSRCYRQEVPQQEEHLYRVPQFTKVEMFVVTSAEAGASDAALAHLVQVQTRLCRQLGLHARVMDMPAHELGASAHRKLDVEAWLPARQAFGEVSSASNCAAFQARRLGVRYRDGATVRFAHSVNGTGCAVPRVLKALMETHQTKYGRVVLPEALRPHLAIDRTELRRQHPPVRVIWQPFLRD